VKEKPPKPIVPIKALVLAHKVIKSAPRVLKEVSWLTEAGWEVDTLGLGSHLPVNGKHIRIKLPLFITRYLSYTVRHNQIKFWLLYGRFLPRNLGQLLEKYDLIVIHEPTFLPSPDLQRFLASNKRAAIHIDLHEDHLGGLARNRFEKLVFDSYRRWEMGFLNRSLASRVKKLSLSTVSVPISEKYATHLGVSVAVVRNAPDYIDIRPSEVNNSRIEIVHHGIGTKHRGIERAIIAMRSLPRHYRLNFHLVTSQTYLTKVRFMALVLGLVKRVKFHKPVPTREISRVLNRYDLALIVIPPVNENERDTLPNKFFESIQARLAIVVGPNPTMAKTVLAARNGVVAKGWGSMDIVEGVLSIEVRDILDKKLASGAFAKQASSSPDRIAFLQCIDRVSKPMLNKHNQ
jgi:hypothetical protein